jgi:general secretion pathway protein L
MPIRLVARMREPITIDFGAPTRVGDLPALAVRFWTWWIGQLREIVPWRRAASPPWRQATLYVRPDRWLLLPSLDGAVVPLDTALSDGALADQMLQLANGASLSRLRVLLPREYVITRRVELPQMSAAHMRQAVELQVDRMSPFKADAVRTAVRVAGRDNDKGTTNVDVAIVPLSRVRPIEQRLRAIGLTPAEVDVEGEGGTGQGFDLSEPPSSEELRRSRALNAGLAIAAVVVWALAVYAWGEAGRGEIERWEGWIAALRPQAERSAVLRQQVEGMIAPIGRANSHDPAETLNVLLELTRVLPDSVRLLDLRLEGDTVAISGLAENAPDVIGLLEKSSAFSDVRFASPVVRKSETGVERFEIAMRLERRAA